jgi:hypothetical protein
MAVLCILAASIIRRMLSRFFILPGFNLTLAAPASIASIARMGRVGTAILTSRQPALTSWFICLTHRPMSTVGTFVIDWMTTGAEEPIMTCPTLTFFVFLLLTILKL